MRRLGIFLLAITAIFSLPAAKSLAGTASSTPVTVQTTAYVLNGGISCPAGTDCSTPSPGNHATLVTVLQQQFSSISAVNLTLHFGTADLVAPGEQLALGQGEGFVNNGTATLYKRAVTLDPAYQPVDAARFVGTTDAALPVWMNLGSTKLCRVDVAITGVLG